MHLPGQRAGCGQVWMQRDLRIDFVRGAGVLMIALDHLPGMLNLAAGPVTSPFITWMRLGWSSAAEFFVFFSGFLVGVVYLQTLNRHGLALTYARAAHRAWQIYVANALTLCAVLVLLSLPSFHNAPLEAATSIDLLSDVRSGSALIAFLTLRMAPAFFEILPLYVLLLLVAPALLLVARKSIAAAVACSVAVWACVQWNPHFNIAGWNFNPFAWQIIFVLGMMCSVGRILERLDAVCGRRKLLIASGALLLLALIVKILDKANWSLPLTGEVRIHGIHRSTVGPLLLLHFLVSVVFVMQIVPRTATIARSTLLAAIARVGQYSLECFCISSVLIYPAVGWMANAGFVSPLAIFIVGVPILGLIVLWALLMYRLRAQPWRSSTAQRTAASNAPAPQRTGTAGDASLPSTLPREPA